MIKKATVLLFVFMLAFSFVISSQANAADMDDVLKRLDQLEAENQSLKAEISSIRSSVTAGAPAVAGTSVVTNKSPLNIKIYGYIKADAVLDDSNGDTLIMNAPDETSSKEDDEFNMTTNETRIGFTFDGPELGYDGKVSGKIETDFWAGGTYGFRLRQGYIKLSYPKWDILAGQTWDFFSPLGPSTLNFGYGWNSGNLGDRHPQLIVTNYMDDVLGGKLTTKVALLDPQVDAAENRGFPYAGAHTSLKTEIFDLPVTIGVGGIYGEQEQAGQLKYAQVWGASTDLQVGITDTLSFKGEAFMGQGMGTFRTVGGTTIVNNKSVRSNGGWVQLSHKTTDKLTTNLGAGMDVAILPDSSTAWDRNLMAFTNVKYKLASNLTLALEYQKFITKYADGQKGDTNRVQSSLIYKF